VPEATIEIAQETLAENQRLRVRATELRSEVAAILFGYRRHRFPHFCGANDASNSEPRRQRNTATPERLAVDVTAKALSR